MNNELHLTHVHTTWAIFCLYLTGSVSLFCLSEAFEPSSLTSKDGLVRSQLFAAPPSGSPKTNGLRNLGWNDHFSQQALEISEKNLLPVRIAEVHKDGFHILGGDGLDELIPTGLEATVGDWLLLNQTQPSKSILLKRKSLIQRKAPGSSMKVQLIAANVDTVFLVTSCNLDFNLARLERYVALSFEAGVAPVILLTKADLREDAPEIYLEAANAISESVPVVLLDARGEEPRRKLEKWCQPFQTIAFLGSSGVGKSTLINSLSGMEVAETRGVKEGDALGRHTTTRRQLHFLSNHCAVIDTPGMKELKLLDAATGVSVVFSDLVKQARECRFNDCRHESEPGCAIEAGIESGQIDEKRVLRWKKLMSEEEHNSETFLSARTEAKRLDKAKRGNYEKRNRNRKHQSKR